MKHFSEYESHEKKDCPRKRTLDNNIYTFDIETSSYLILNGKMIPACKYESLTDEEKEASIKQSCMYIWMFSINEDVYYGRTWGEYKKFIDKVNENVPELKLVYAHNLSFEFEYLSGEFDFENVLSRKSRKVMSATHVDYNIEYRCTLVASNVKLERLPKMFSLNVKKLVGNLDYSKVRHSKTELSTTEMEYCENDCLVLYEYIKRMLETYEFCYKIPLTSTGQVRRELKSLVLKDMKYRYKVKKAINTDPLVYNMLVEAFAGGYTHANWIYADEVIKNVSSFDETSAYPYFMVTHKFPSSKFKKCFIKDEKFLSKKLAYLIKIKYKNIKCKYFNNFISASKCREIRGGAYDNGRVIKASELETTITDIDFYLIKDTYDYEEYEIIDIYYANYNYLPIQFINFILDKYVVKTQYKGIVDKALEYNKEKNKFNALYGMSVTNNIKDRVVYDNLKLWSEEKLTNKEIIDALLNEEKQAFLSFSYGVWITAYARNVLCRMIAKNDEYTVYGDTDSVKLREGFDIKNIDDYNETVKSRINYVSKTLNIPIERFSPKDIKGRAQMLGLFKLDHEYPAKCYEAFITQGAKKYAYIENGEIHITVSGVPKEGHNGLKSLEDFKDDFVFEHKDTNKNTIVYNDYQIEFDVVDYLGETFKMKDKRGCCVLPATYKLGKSLEYAELISDASSARSIYKEI